MLVNFPSGADVNAIGLDILHNFGFDSVGKEGDDKPEFLDLLVLEIVPIILLVDVLSLSNL